MTSNSNANPALLQGRQLQIYQAVSQHMEQNVESPFHMIVVLQGLESHLLSIV